MENHEEQVENQLWLFEVSGAGIINSAAIIVRYFGGIKLELWISQSLWWFFK